MPALGGSVYHLRIERVLTVPDARKSFGDRAEEFAANFLKENGYKIICRNYKTRLGEVDIIAQDNDTVCFIEVKARKSGRFGTGAESVSALKQRQVSKAALIFLKEKRLLNNKARFDVVSLDYSSGKAEAELIKNAFELSPDFTY
jgi:putative endonuclease